MLAVSILLVCALFLVLFALWRRKVRSSSAAPSRKSFRELLESNPVKPKILYLGIYKPEYLGVLELTDIYVFNFHSGFDPISGLRVRCNPPEPSTGSTILYLKSEGFLIEKIKSRKFVDILVDETNNLDDPNPRHFIGKGVIELSRSKAESEAINRLKWHEKYGEEYK
jgi:hypothetical protein